MAKHVLKAEPTQEQEPLTLSLARLHLKLDAELEGEAAAHPDDSLVNMLISAAREHAENFTGLSLVNREHSFSLDEFPCSFIDLQVWPVTAITEVSYVDENGATQILPSGQYRLDNVSRPARLYTVENTWPTTKKQDNAISVRFAAGFNDAIPMPKTLKQSMLLIIGHLYENRQDVIHSSRTGGQLELPMGSVFLMTPHRINMRL